MVLDYEQIKLKGCEGVYLTLMARLILEWLNDNILAILLVIKEPIILFCDNT